MTSTSVSATTWVDLKPQKVLEQAEVIVLGTYTFSSEAKNGRVFNGFEFDVREIILGDYVEPLIAGIDVHDVSWAAEFQEEGGEFLLFLERNEIANFLVPVGGINGVLKFSEGEIIHPDKKKKVYFEKYLRAQPQSESLGVVESSYQWEVMRASWLTDHRGSKDR